LAIGEINAMARHPAAKPVSLLLVATVLCRCQTLRGQAPDNFSYFTGLKNFSSFAHSSNEKGETVLLSPTLKSRIPWNQLIVSWNASTPAGTFLKVEAAANSNGHQTKFYAIANWSLDNQAFPRASIRGQEDADGTVDTDTLILKHPAESAQLRVTCAGTNGGMALKFLGLSFANTAVPPPARPANRAAWGKTISTPERSQHGYPNEKGWCSPASLSMVLARWAEVLGRPELDLTVPQVAAAVYDSDFAGTGNWPFNTAFAGGFSGIRSYVTRFDDLSEVEDWIAAGIPVILSTRWDLLQPGRPPAEEGHLIVCIGFTKDGEVVVNDPATRLDRGEIVRRVYKRENVLGSWTKSHHAVYLVYPEGSKIPPDRFGHWES
jgi:hypothetical protein